MEQRRFHLLDVNLSTGRHELVDVTDQIRQFVGGRAYGAKLLWDHVPPGADPLSADNVLYVGIGPITGLLGSVTSLSAKSPLTLLRGVSHLNGHFGCELVYAGCHAGVLIRGAAAKPVYLCIDNGEVDIRDAGHLWGGTQLACQQALHAELKSRGEDQDFRFLSIGPAGENLVRNADVAHDLYHHAARSGMGTVMGAKRLKAIAVRGNRPPGYPDPGALYRLMRTMLLETREYQARFRRWGHTMSMARRYEATTEGVQNKMKGWDDTCTLFNPVILEQQYKVWSDSCSGCFVGCKVPYFQMPPPYGPVAGELRHDNAGGWSANALVAGYEPQAYLSAYVDHLGLDGEDVSGVVTWVMECYQ
jgi:aldehyde:ferredoxin oxidoreductase